MRKCVCSVRPPSIRVSRCLPAATTSRTVRPVRSTVASRGTRKSVRPATRPASASCRRRPASQTVSPSGTTAILPVRPGDRRVTLSPPREPRDRRAATAAAVGTGQRGSWGLPRRDGPPGRRRRCRHDARPVGPGLRDDGHLVHRRVTRPAARPRLSQARGLPRRRPRRQRRLGCDDARRGPGRARPATPPGTGIPAAGTTSGGGPYGEAWAAPRCCPAASRRSSAGPMPSTRPATTSWSSGAWWGSPWTLRAGR